MWWFSIGDDVAPQGQRDGQNWDWGCSELLPDFAHVQGGPHHQELPGLECQPGGGRDTLSWLYLIQRSSSLDV